MDLVGKTTINPLVFYTGKIAGYITWIAILFEILGIGLFDKYFIYYNNCVAIILFIIGFVLSIISMINLGKSTRLGLPSNGTSLKTKGLYKISRNPMYVGFNLITISSILYTLNWIIAILGVYSLITYHLIIKGEEKFLISRFGDDYKAYTKKSEALFVKFFDSKYGNQ